MKTPLALIAIFVVAALPLHAVSFDLTGFGARLNGWTKNRSATYQLTDGSYRTHVPTVTATPSGGMFLSTQVDLLKPGTATCHLGLTFSAAGFLESAQIKGMVDGAAVDTGLVRAPEPPSAMAPVEGAATVPPRPFRPTDELIAALFSQFDTEVQKAIDARGERRDLFSRLSKQAKSADLSAALRHNLNLILQNVRG